MPTNFPNGTDAFTNKTPHVSVNAAADVNNLQDAVLALETALLSAPNPNTLDYMSKSRPDTVTGVKHFSAAPIFDAGFSVSAGQVAFHGAGDNLSAFNATSAQLVDVRAGTSVTGDAVAQPLSKFSRTINLQAVQVSGDGVDYASTFQGGSYVLSTGQVQGVGVHGFATTESSYSVGSQSADAVGVYGVGRSVASSTRVGIGGYLAGRAEGANSKASGVQVAIANYTGSDHSVNASGFSQTNALWVVAAGANRVAAGLQFGNPFGVQMDVGIHANSQNPFFTAFLQDDSNAPYSALTKGTHSSAAYAVAAGSGSIIVGGTVALFSPALLEVRATTGGGAFTPLAAFSHPDTTSSMSVRFRNQSGSSDYFASGGTNQIMTGSGAGDTGIVINTANKFWMVGPAGGYVLRIGQANSIDVGNATAVLNYNYAVTALGGGAAPTLGTIGGSGPATAGQNGWLKVNIAGTASYIPMWR